MSPNQTCNHTRRFWVPVLLLIVAAAAILRLAYLDRLPPGLSFDEAYNDVIATRITLLPPPVFIPVEFGKEPASMVLIAVLYRLVGHAFAEGGRLVSALSGIAAVAMLFFTAREMFRKHAGEAEATIVGLLSAGVLAILYWHVHYSRLGMEPPMTPAFATLAFYLFWRALNRPRWPVFVLAGAALGLCLYTYLAGYMLPIVVAIYLVWRWAAHRDLLKAEWRGALGYVAGALLVFSPQLIFFIRHPEWLAVRPGQVSPGAWDVPLKNIARMVGGLFWRGDTNMRLNLPGRPALDPVQSVAFLAGLWFGLSGSNVPAGPQSGGKQSRRAGAVFAVIWLIVMLAPSIVSDVSPHFGRALGATPPLAILVALGLREIQIRATHLASAPHVGAPHARIAGAFVVGLALLYSGARTVNDYFNVWANDPGMFTAFDVGLRQSSEYLSTLPPDDALSLSPAPRDAPIFQFYLGSRLDQFKTFNGRRCVVYPYQPARDFVHVAIVAEDKQSLPTLQAVFPQGRVVHEITDLGARYAAVYRVPAGSRAQVALEPAASFASAIQLARPADLARTTFEPGETVAITLTWRALAAMTVDYTSFVHLARQPGEPPLAQEDAQPCDNSYPTAWWSPGEIIAETRMIHLPPDLPAGDYVLSAGWYDLNTGQRLPVDSGGDSVILVSVHIAP